MRWMDRLAGIGAAVAFGAALGACASPPPPREAPLVADPPLNGAGAIEDGLAATEIQRGLTYLQGDKIPEAKEHFEKALATQPNNPKAAFFAGLTREKTGDRAGAEEAYKLALAADPSLVEAAQNLSALYLDDPPRADEAVALLKSALLKAPDNVELLQNLGYAYGLLGDVDRASKAYEAALAKSDTAALHLAYGTLLFDAKLMDRAAAELRKALAKADDLATIATVGRMLGPAKDFADCVAAFDKAIAKKADVPELFVRRGTCRHELHDEAGARADFRQAIQLDASYAPAHYYLGVSYVADKKKMEGIKELEKAASLGSGTPIGKAAEEKLREARAGIK